MSDQIQYESQACRRAEPARFTVLRRAEVLRKTELFSRATVEELLHLAAISREVRFGAGETIFARGEPADALYILIGGRVELEGDAPREAPGPFQAVGLYEVLSDQRRAATARAAEETLALKIETLDFFDLLSHNIEIVQGLFRLLIQKLSGMR